MKILGYVFIVFAALNFLVAVLMESAGEPQTSGNQLSAVIMFGVLGAFCLSRAKKKEEEEKEKEKWRKGE